MEDSWAGFLLHGLSVLFAIGIVGCLGAIPITAFRLFSTLFEKDKQDGQ